MEREEHDRAGRRFLDRRPPHARRDGRERLEGGIVRFVRDNRRGERRRALPPADENPGHPPAADERDPGHVALL
jgi:hypothetical protein